MDTNHAELVASIYVAVDDAVTITEEASDLGGPLTREDLEKL